MGLEKPLTQVDSVATGPCQQSALHALCLPEIVGYLNSTLGSIFADDITVPQRQTLYCHADTASSLCMVKSNGFNLMTPPGGHDAHISGFLMQGDLVGAGALTGGRYGFTAQTLSRSTVCRFPFARLRDAQFRQPALAHGLLQAIAHQNGQAQHQMTRTVLPVLARFGLLIQDISTYYKRRNLSGTEFELPMPRTDISDSLALAPETISRLIGSFIEKKILIFENKTVHLLDHHALEHACEALN